MPGEWHPVGRSTIWLDPYQARVLRAMDATVQGSGLRLSYALYPLHMGGGLGETYRTFVAATGLLPTLLLVTGFLFWRRRQRRTASTRTTARSTPAERIGHPGPN